MGSDNAESYQSEIDKNEQLIQNAKRNIRNVKIAAYLLIIFTLASIVSILIILNSLN